MTQKELLSLEHLKVAELKEGYFLHVHTEDGYFLTSWKEDDNVKNYNGSVCIYAPIMENYPDYRIVTKDIHENLEAQRNKILEEEELQFRISRYKGNTGATAPYVNKTI